MTTPICRTEHTTSTLLQDVAVGLLKSQGGRILRSHRAHHPSRDRTYFNEGPALNSKQLWLVSAQQEILGRNPEENVENALEICLRTQENDSNTIILQQDSVFCKYKQFMYACGS